MEIKSAKFIKGIKGSDDILNDSKPHIAFVGRSNVGKSSVINSLTGGEKLVKSSSVPGKTQEINFFEIEMTPKTSGSVKKFYFVDLPGYGFAKLQKDQREKLRKLILWYLLSEEVRNKKVVFIIDFKVGPSKFDLEMLYLLKENDIDFIVVANKIDKISKGARLRQKKEIEKIIHNEDIILYSAKTGEGKQELINKLIL